MHNNPSMPARPTRLSRLRRRVRRLNDRVLGVILDWIDAVAGTGHSAPRRPLSETERRVGIGIVGCGFVADFYVGTLVKHPELEVIGVFDREEARAAKLAARLGVPSFPTLEALLSERRVEILVNLTNPDSHYEISKASLLAGKHVYSEKPLAMDIGEATDLVATAKACGVRLSSAPCSALGETARALRKVIDEGAVGSVRLVYAELDDGPIHRMQPDGWISPEGTPWPWRDEFTVGCTIEHAAYHLTWLVALFGPAQSVTAFASRRVPAKHPDLAPEAVAPDFSVACVVFKSGVIARLTCSIVAPHDHALRIIGDEGEIVVDECWHNGAPIRLNRFTPLGLRAETYPWIRRNALTRRLFRIDGSPHSLSPAADLRRRLRRHEMDYLLGVSDLAAALQTGSEPALSAGFALHINEIVLAIDSARETGATVQLCTNLS